ncbi:MAG: DUF5684 domain-containing protein [Halobacteria archaeon]|nr:DUF5684 domain-containing protein [Halobacteria archaeon]
MADSSIIGLLIPVIWLVVMIAIIGGYWKVFSKAGQPGWAAIIPIYNLWIMVKVADTDSDVLWFVLSFLFWIPLVKVTIDIAKNFGKGTGYGIGLFILPFIFFPMLGFGDAQYQAGG